jgi:hypothetical protein
MFSNGRDNNATRMVVMCARKWRAAIARHDKQKQFSRKRIRERRGLSSLLSFRSVSGCGVRHGVSVAFAYLSFVAAAFSFAAA